MDKAEELRMLGQLIDQGQSLTHNIVPMAGPSAPAVPPAKLGVAQMAALAAKSMQETKGTFGSHEVALPNGAGARVVVSKRAGNSRGANRGSHLKNDYVYRAPGDDKWTAVSQDQFKSLMGEK
jgi:hypothetical protein